MAADDIHRQLDRILESSYFQVSLRLTRFLKFVVETTLAGKPETIKAYTIAVDALDRGEDFDPQRDPIVRVEAGRLRAALARYYADEGRHDALVIEVPRGGYVPTFRRAPDEQLTELVPERVESPPAAVSQWRATDWLETRSLVRAVRLQSGALKAEISATKEICALSRGLLCDIAKLCEEPLIGGERNN